MASQPCDAIALGVTAIGSLVFWAKQAQPAACGAADGSSMTAAEAAGHKHGGWCAAAHSRQGLLFLACAAAAALLLALSFTPRWQRWRAWAVAALRLGLFPTMPWAPQLCVAPGSWAVDAARVVQASRTFRLLFFGIGLLLDLPAHLAVHTLCLAIAIADAPRACALPVLTGHVPAARIATAHLLIGSLGTSGMLRYFPPGDPQVQCIAALNTFCLFLGWLVPTYFALRHHHEAAQKRHQQGQRQSRLARGAAEPAGPAGSFLAQAGRCLGPRGSDGGGAGPAGPLAGGRRSWLPSLDASVAWILDNLFLHNTLLPELSMAAWWILAAFCWIGGGLLALATAS